MSRGVRDDSLFVCVCVCVCLLCVCACMCVCYFEGNDAALILKRRAKVADHAHSHALTKRAVYRDAVVVNEHFASHFPSA